MIEITLKVTVEQLRQILPILDGSQSHEETKLPSQYTLPSEPATKPSTPINKPLTVQPGKRTKMPSFGRSPEDINKQNVLAANRTKEKEEAIKAHKAKQQEADTIKKSIPENINVQSNKVNNPWIKA